MISLLYPSSRIKSGYVNYSMRLLKGLRGMLEAMEEIPVRKIEIGLFGKPVLGNVSQSFFARLASVHGDVVHSLTPNVINSRTNLVTIHDLISFKNQQKFATSVYRRYGYKSLIRKIRKVDNFIVFTEQAKVELSDLFGIERERINVVQQSIDHDIFYREVNEMIKPVNKKLIITVGDLNPRKRYDVLFRALGGIDDYKIVHIGPVNGWYEKKKELEKIKSSFTNISMIGEVNDTALRQFMSTADLVVQLSEGEGFGSIPLEAMACGTNVLVSNLEIFHETLNGYANYTNLNEEEVLEAVTNALKSPRSMQELINFTKRFSIDSMARSTSNVYRKLSP